MARQAWTPITFDGQSVNGSGNILMEFPTENSPFEPGGVDPVEASITRLGRADVGSQPRGSTWVAQVTLAASDETDVLAMFKVFDETAGLVYLRANDGSGTLWRIACRVVGPPAAWAGTSDHFWVTLRVPNPIWETDAATTDNQQNKTTSVITPAGLTNIGDRDCAPVFTLNVDANKSINSALDDYAFALATILVNRAPKDLNDVPVWLFDAAGVQSRLATDSSASGATVKQTTGATTITANIAAGDTVIHCTSTAGFNANGGMFWIQDTRGAGFHDQGYYTGKAGNDLTGVVWFAAAANGGSSNPTGALQTGGGIAHTTVQVTNIQPSGVKLSGDDCRAWLDDVPNVNRWLVNWNAATSDVCIVASFKAAVPLTLTEAMTASVPADGGSFTVKESMALLPQSDFYVMIENEVIYVATRDDHTCSGIKRAAWGTTAASHALSATVYPNPRRVIVAAGYAKAGAPPCPPSERPCMQIKGSSNQTWKYGDQSDDDQTVYYDPLNPNRAMMWVPGFDSDGNTVSPLMSLSAYGNIVTFKDDVPGDGSPPYNNLELTVPFGLKTGDANAIKNDWTPHEEILNLELFTRDAAGVLKLIDQKMTNDGGSATISGRTLAASLGAPSGFTSIPYAVKLKGRYAIAVGSRATGTTDPTDNTTTGGAGMEAIVFTLEKATAIKDIILYLRASGAGTTGFDIGLYTWSGSNTDLIQYYKSTSIASTSDAFFHLTPEVNFVVPAGTYAVRINRTDFAGPTVLINTRPKQNLGRISTAAMSLKRWDGTNWATINEDPYCLILATYDQSLNANINSDQPVRTATAGTRTATTASFDKTELILSTTQSVYVNRLSAFVNGATAGAMYHAKGTLASSTTGESGVLDVWLRTSGVVTIDCDNMLVSKTEDSIEAPIGRAYDGDFITLVPGANTVTYTDASNISPGQIDLATAFRSRKA